MDKDELFSYLVATDQLDEFLGYKEKDEINFKCPECGNELVQYDEDNSKWYCSDCNIVYIEDLSEED